MEGEKTLLCIGINPSTAAPKKLDNTVNRVKSRALALGYDSWIMINIYPQRATDPNDLDKVFNSVGHKKNIAAIKKVLKGRNVDVWAAWGTLIEKRPYLKTCLYDLYKALGSGINWISIGRRSVAGHPHHPLYLKNGLIPDSFDIEEYIESLGVENTKKREGS